MTRLSTANYTASRITSTSVPANSSSVSTPSATHSRMPTISSLHSFTKCKSRSHRVSNACCLSSSKYPDVPAYDSTAALNLSTVKAVSLSPPAWSNPSPLAGSQSNPLQKRPALKYVVPLEQGAKKFVTTLIIIDHEKRKRRSATRLEDCPH